MVVVPLSENPNGRAIVIVLGVFLVLDYVFVLMRFWARQIQNRSLEFNDWAMVSALILVSVLYFVECAAVRNGGVGLHVMDIAYHWGGYATLFTAGKLVLTSDLLWNLSTLTIKMSILHLYITIFGVTSPRFRQICWAVMGVCVLSTTIFIIQILVLCRPLAFFWDKSIPGGRCGSLNYTYLIPGIIITLEDIAVFLLPMHMLWKLKLKTSKKMGTIFIFGLGLGICLMSGVRLKYVIDLDTADFTASIWQFAILGTLEPMFGIISACLPVVPSLVSHYSDHRIMAWTQKDNSHNSYKNFGSGRRSPNDDMSYHSEIVEFDRLSDKKSSTITRVKPAANSQNGSGNWNQDSAMEMGTIKVNTSVAVDNVPQSFLR